MGHDLTVNIIGNAVEAAQETEGAVMVGREVAESRLVEWVEGEGPGIGDGSNPFVPFFTTRAWGSGTGLALSRRIAEAQAGDLRLGNRQGRSGCRAEFRLPRADGAAVSDG